MCYRRKIVLASKGQKAMIGTPVIFCFLVLMAFAGSAQDLKIYSLNYFKKDSGQQPGFVSLTDFYRLSEHTDSVVISAEYLGRNQIEDRNYHVLSPAKRRRFLNEAGISESDSIFSFHLGADTVTARRVKEQALVAILDIYSLQPPLREQDYMIGFEIADEGSEGFGDLIYIGQDSPFQTGEIKPVFWEVADSGSFPAKLDTGANAPWWFKKYVPLNTFQYTTQNLNYFVRNLELEGRLNARHLAVVDSQTDSVIFNKVYEDRESTYLLPLSKKHEDNDGQTQWIGSIFKDRPPVIFGFLGNTFGCPVIDFIGSEPPLQIHCDNRH